MAAHAQSREEAIFELCEEIRKGFNNKHDLNPEKQKVMFKDLAEQYLENYAKTNNLAWKRDMTCMKNLVEFIGDYYLQDVSPLLIEKYKSDRMKKGVEPATVNRELSVLKRAFNLAIDWKMTDENPVQKVNFLR
ncbi:MAG: phage integrase SAM-like domain-containing protein, partial [Candidatus Aminicenantes bacterium]